MNIFVFKVDVKNAAGTPVTEYWSTKARITSATSTPAGVTFRELVKDPGGLSLRVFGNGRAAGLLQRTWGEIETFNTAGTFNGWADYNTHDGTVTCHYGPDDGEYPADFAPVFIARILGRPLINDRRMRLSLRGREIQFEKQVVTAGFAGTGGLEGSGVAGSSLRQLVIGAPGYIAPILIDEVDNVWYVQESAPLDWADLENGSDPPRYTPHDGGIPLLANGLFLDAASIFTEPVDPGQYMHWAGVDGEGPVYLKLGSQVEIDLRYPAVGAIVDDPGVTLPRAWTVFDLAIRAGITDADPDTLPTGTTNFDAGNRLIQAQTYAEVFSDIALFQYGSIGFNQVDQFTARKIEAPSGSVYTFTEGQNSRRWDIAPLPGMERRVWQVAVRAGATHGGALALDATDAVRDQLVRDPHLTSFVASSQDVLDADSSAERVEIDIVGNEFPNQTAMEAWATRFLTINGAKHFPLTFEADINAGTLALRPLDTVTMVSANYGTRSCIIVGIEQRLKTRKLGFTVLGLTDSPADIVITRSDEAVGAGGGGAGTGVTGTHTNAQPVYESFVIACSDETTALTAGTAKRTIPAFPTAFIVEEVQAALVTAQTSGSIFTVDINIAGVTMLSTKLTIDNTETSSITAATPCVISDSSIAKGDKITIDIDQVGDGTAKGLVVTILGRRA